MHSCKARSRSVERSPERRPRRIVSPTRSSRATTPTRYTTTRRSRQVRLPRRGGSAGRFTSRSRSRPGSKTRPARPHSGSHHDTSSTSPRRIGRVAAAARRARNWLRAATPTRSQRATISRKHCVAADARVSSRSDRSDGGSPRRRAERRVHRRGIRRAIGSCAIARSARPPMRNASSRVRVRIHNQSPRPRSRARWASPRRSRIRWRPT